MPKIPLPNLDIPDSKNFVVGSKRRATNEGSAALGIDIQLLASTDKIMNTERDVSKERLSPPASEAGSSFRQSQYGDGAQPPLIITTEFTGGDAKERIRKSQKASKKDGGDKGSISSILTPMFRDKEEKEHNPGNTPTAHQHSEFSFAASLVSKQDLQQIHKLSEKSGQQSSRWHKRLDDSPHKRKKASSKDTQSLEETKKESQKGSDCNGDKEQIELQVKSNENL